MALWHWLLLGRGVLLPLLIEEEDTDAEEIVESDDEQPTTI